MGLITAVALAAAIVIAQLPIRLHPGLEHIGHQLTMVKHESVLHAVIAQARVHFRYF